MNLIVLNAPVIERSTVEFEIGSLEVGHLAGDVDLVVLSSFFVANLDDIADIDVTPDQFSDPFLGRVGWNR